MFFMPPQKLDKNNGLAVRQLLFYEAKKGVSLMDSVGVGKDKYELFLSENMNLFHY